jgi:hypothetical protein
MVKKLTPAQKKALITALSKKRATCASYRRHVLTIKFDGHLLKNKVVKRREPGIGDWARRHHVIYFDRLVKDVDLLPVLIHEALEKYCAQHYGLHTQSEAHRVALAVERRFIADACSRSLREKCTHSGRCWRKHEERIQGAWLVENYSKKKRLKKAA